MKELDPVQEYLDRLGVVATQLDNLSASRLPEGVFNITHMAASAKPFRPLFAKQFQGATHAYEPPLATYDAWTTTTGRRVVGDPTTGPSPGAQASIQLVDAINVTATQPVWFTANLNIETVSNRRVVALDEVTSVVIGVQVLGAAAPALPFTWTNVLEAERWMHPGSAVIPAQDGTHMDVPISTLITGTVSTAWVKGFRLTVSIVNPKVAAPVTRVVLNRWSMQAMHLTASGM